jgi:hypothetical protein
VKNGVGVATELVAQRRRVARTGIVANGAHPRPEGRGAGLLGAAAPQHTARRERHAPNEFLDGARLADPGLADDREQAHASCARVAEPGFERRELALPPDELDVARGCRGVHGTSLGQRRLGRKIARRIAASEGGGALHDGGALDFSPVFSVQARPSRTVPPAIAP